MVAVVGVDIVVPGLVLGLCVAIFVVAFGLMSIENPFGVLAPRQITPYAFLFLV